MGAEEIKEEFLKFLYEYDCPLPEIERAFELIQAEIETIKENVRLIIQEEEDKKKYIRRSDREKGRKDGKAHCYFSQCEKL